METITILANALAKAGHSDISRLDIQFNAKDDMFKGYLTLVNGIKFGIFDAFKNDEETFRNKFKIKTEYLNIVTVIFAIFSFLFVVIFIFLTLSIYTEPIKKSAYRISRSLYYIKIYNIFNYRKSTLT